MAGAVARSVVQRLAHLDATVVRARAQLTAEIISSTCAQIEELAEQSEEIENSDIEGSPELTVDRTIESVDVTVLSGTGIRHHKQAGRFAFVYSDLFTFRGELIKNLQSVADGR